jgi:hypothetical protein
MPARATQVKARRIGAVPAAPVTSTRIGSFAMAAGGEASGRFWKRGGSGVVSEEATFTG